jgi:hypothetical protein
MGEVREVGYSHPPTDPGPHPQGDRASAYAEWIPLRTRGGGRPPQVPLSQQFPG